MHNHVFFLLRFLYSQNKGNIVKSGKKGIRRIIAALFFSISGLKACVSEEVSFRQILAISACFFIVACFLGRDFFEIAFLVLPLFFMIFAELVNTAIEKIIDLVQPTFHPLARDAKDIGSSLQFACMIFATFIWGGYLIERFVL